MGIVDPADDTVQRFVVLHYRFDPARRQRTDVTVAAFDDETEFLQDLERRRRRLHDQQAAGLAEAAERISGVVKEAGYAARQDARRAEWKRFSRKKHRARKRGRT
jgi:hypothetical protein